MTRVVPRRASLALVALACAFAVVLTSCAADPVAGWRPPKLEPVPGMELVTSEISGAAGASAAVDGAEAQDLPTQDDGGGGSVRSGADEAGTADGADDMNDADDAGEVSAPPRARPQLSASELGLYEGRLRNDDVLFAARFVYVPGVPEFNAWMDAQLWAAINERSNASGAQYRPQVHDIGAGFGARGCVPGSISWRASDVLARPETGPASGAGVAMTCEVTGAFGDLIEVRVRTVSGATDDIQRDDTRVVYANVRSGKIVEIVDEWTDEAPGELWRGAVELLRRQAGALSTAEVLAPDEAQLELALQALDGSREADDGGLFVTIAAGLASPELAGLGIEQTSQPIEVHVQPATALSWSNDEYRELHSAIGQPFEAEVDPVFTVSIDCNLIPCVALTYDDGPSDYTQQLLDTLESEQARATFFMMGSKAGGWSRTIARVAAEGHQIGSHTMNHPDLTSLPLEEAKAQVLDAATALSAASGQTVNTFRPPYGAINDEIIEAVGMPAILWSIDTNDWRKPGKEALIERSAVAARVGDIILFHDIHEESVQVAGDVVRGLHDRGFETVTVNQLFDGNVAVGRVSAR